jgi:hypothetical protein
MPLKSKTELDLWKKFLNKKPGHIVSFIFWVNYKFLCEILHLEFSISNLIYMFSMKDFSYDINISTKNKYFPKNTFFQKSVKNFPQKKTFYRADHFFAIYYLENSWADKISLHGI